MQPCEDVPIGAFPWTDAPEEAQVHNCIAHLANLFCGEVHGWVMQAGPSPQVLGPIFGGMVSGFQQHRHCEEG